MLFLSSSYIPSCRFPVGLDWGLAGNALVFESLTTLSESDMPPHLPKEVHAFVSKVGLFSVLQDFQCDYAQAYLTYHSSCG